MNVQSFKLVAKSFIEPFEKYGFRSIDEQHHPADFGNAFITFANGFSLRVIRDRGQLFVEVGPPLSTDDWYDLRIVLAFLGETSEMQSPDEAGLDELRVKFEPYYNRIHNLFSVDNFPATKIQLDQFRTERARKLFEQHWKTQ